MLMVAGRIAMLAAIRLPMVLFLTMLLVCFAPGFDSDERQLDLRFSAESIANLKQSRSQERSPIWAYGRYVAGVVRGDFGHSETFKRPVSELLVERYALTLRSVGIGAVLGWTAAAFLASTTTLLPSTVLQGCSASIAGMLLCVPSALLGFLAVVFHMPIAAAMSCIVFSRVFLQLKALFHDSGAAPHVFAAQVMGIPQGPIFRWHIVGANLPHLIALAASSITVAIGTAVPLEVISDTAGLGQLAWRAALGRDLPVLMGVTLIIAAVNTVAAATTDIANNALRRQAA
jgi:peptide/nickel transport system permease protein